MAAATQTGEEKQLLPQCVFPQKKFFVPVPLHKKWLATCLYHSLLSYGSFFSPGSCPKEEMPYEDLMTELCEVIRHARLMQLVRIVTELADAVFILFADKVSTVSLLSSVWTKSHSLSSR